MFLLKKDRSQESFSSLEKFSGSPQSQQVDVLMATASKSARPKVAVIGDRKIAAAPLSNAPVTQVESPKQKKAIQQATESKSAAGVLEKKSRVVFDDPLVAEPIKKPSVRPSSNTKDNLRRESGYQKVSPRGGDASARGERRYKQSAVDEVRASVTRKIIFRALGVLSLVSVFAGIAYVGSDPIAHVLERPLKSVAVEGQFQYLPKERAMALIDSEIDGDFLQLDLGRLKNILLSDPWVDSVYLSRRWPDTLVVKISEQKPIARWGENGYLNQRGDIIRINDTEKLKGLPWLQGSEKNTHEMLQQYQDISTLLRAHGLEIIALQCDDKKSWKIKLKNDAEIAIGREQVMEKLRRFVTVYDKFLSSVWSDVAGIDIRYTNGVAVRWKPDSDMAKKNNNEQHR